MKKTVKKLVTASTLTLALVSSAKASVIDSAGTWYGSGAVYSLEGKALGDYRVEMANTLTSPREMKSEITVTRLDGTLIQRLNQTIKDTDHGFTSDSEQGQGGGFCLGEGMCMSYVGSQTARAFASTLVVDPPSALRILRTELQNGKAVQFYREKYVRIHQ